MKAIVVEHFGGPDALVLREVPTPTPGLDQALVRLAAAGVNFIDVYHREGRYPGSPPFTPGNEGAGVVEKVGAAVTTVQAGDRVAYVLSRGSYAEYAVVDAAKLVKLPAGVDERQAAAVMLQGMTAHYLTHDTYPVSRGDDALVHAAAGGVGLLLVQYVKRRGGRVIATASTQAKAELARGAGADEVLLYGDGDAWAERVRELTGGAGVHVAYDGVGTATFEGSLRSLRRRGFMVLFGASSGAVPPMDPLRLMEGSVFLTRPTLGDYVATREDLEARAGAVFGDVAAGRLDVRIGGTYALADAAQAHRDLEARKTTGKLLILP